MHYVTKWQDELDVFEKTNKRYELYLELKDEFEEPIEEPIGEPLP